MNLRRFKWSWIIELSRCSFYLMIDFDSKKAFFYFIGSKPEKHEIDAINKLIEVYDDKMQPIDSEADFSQEVSYLLTHKKEV